MNDFKLKGVYEILSLSTKERYIGSASSVIGIQGRFDGHVRQLRKGVHTNWNLQNLYNQYGESNLIFSPVEICTPEECLEREQFWIDLICPKLNIMPKAGSRLGSKQTDEARKKMSVAQKGLSKPPRTPEQCRHYAFHLGRKLTPEHKAKISAGMTGIIFTEERCKNISASLMGRKLSPEHIEKMRKGLTGLKHSDVTRAKMSASHKRHLESKIIN